MAPVVGLTDALVHIGANEQVPTTFEGIWRNARIWINSVRTEIDPILWVITVIFTLIPGTFAITKWWYYRESQLPARLRDVLEREDERLAAARPKLATLAASGRLNAKVSPEPRFFFAHEQLASTLQALSLSRWWFPLHSADAELQVALEKIIEQEQFCEKQQRSYASQKVTTYLLRGAIAAARAGQAQYEQRIQLHRDALGCFLAADDLEPKNPEIIAYVAHQHRELNDTQAAREKYEELVELVEDNTEWKLEYYVMALRCLAEVLERQFEETRIKARLQDATKILEQASRAIPASGRQQLEHASVCEAAGRVYEKMTELPRAEKNYKKAAAIYGELSKLERSSEYFAEAADRLTLAINRVSEKRSALADNASN
ncbi:MAG: hypothetical protein NW216_02680 [Hyphomicrobium sp.]|nr:hypothetical protein [Hyphomicrobium sp.]